jgi:hypothetical protein
MSLPLLRDFVVPRRIIGALGRLGLVIPIGRWSDLRGWLGLIPLARLWHIDRRLGAAVERGGLRGSIRPIRHLVQPIRHLFFCGITTRDGTFLVHQRIRRIVRSPSNGTQRLTFETVNFRGIGAPAALQLEVLPDGFVE